MQWLVYWLCYAIFNMIENSLWIVFQWCALSRYCIGSTMSRYQEPDEHCILC